MFFAYELIKKAYKELIKLDESTGKSRKEKISGLRYLLASSELLQSENFEKLNLAVGSDYRTKFVEAVGNVVSLGENGLYTKDFADELDNSKDYGVGSNFLTTRLANSRTQNIKYPGRPASLLLLEKENVSIIDNIDQTLENSYGIGNIKSQLCLWLLRNEKFDKSIETLNDSLFEEIEIRLKTKYTADVVEAILPSKEELVGFLSDYENDYFSDGLQSYSDIPEALEIKNEDESLTLPKVLIDDLPDEDNIFKSVQQLLTRGAKGILFGGPPGTSKTWYAIKIATKITGGDENKLEKVQFHPSYTYEDFIEGLVSTGSANSEEPMFKPKSKVFLNLCEKAKSDLDNLYILIIDEFTRGDPSKIFGELLTYIESDYREIKFRLPYSENETSIPQNVIIFATMNPYDKSVADLDSAMERRFEVVELLPNFNILRDLLKAENVDNQLIGKIIDFFKIANRLSPHGFGHTYFKNINNEKDLILLWNHKLKFIFEKMFRFQDDSFNEIRQSYISILEDSNKTEII